MTAAVGYIWFYIDREYSWMIFIPVVIAVVIYIFHGPLDYWYFKKNTPPLDKKLIQWLEKHFPWYQWLKEDYKQEFHRRIVLYMYAREFQAIGKETRDVPEDIKCMIAAHAILLTSGKDDYLVGDIDRIYLYKHPFPSPRIPSHHSVETDMEDGVVILNSNLLMQALISPQGYYNIALHAFTEALCHIFPENDLTALNQEMLEALERKAGWSLSEIQRQTGLAQIPDYCRHVHHFFVFYKEYRELMPENETIIRKYLNLPIINQ
jgi:hypothetical protein